MMSEIQTQPSPETEPSIGDRIREAREALGLNQALLAERVGIPRTALSAIEHGKRQVSAAELVRFAEALGRPFDFFLGPAVPAAHEPPSAFGNAVALKEPAPQATAYAASPARAPSESARRVLLRFEDLSRHCLELEDIGGLPSPRVMDLGFEPGRFAQRDAGRLADLVRSHLGLGDSAPVFPLRRLLEARLGIKTFVLRSESGLIAACLHDRRLGGCVLLTRQSDTRMRSALAHVVGHVLTNRSAVVDEDPPSDTAAERFAGGFAASLLMPQAGVRERFWSIYETRRAFTDLEVTHLARYFGVTEAAMADRLQALRLIPPSVRKRLARRPPSAARERFPRGAQPPAASGTEPPWEPLPERYVFLALRAYRRDEISIGRLAELLCDEDGHPVSVETAQELVRAYPNDGLS